MKKANFRERTALAAMIAVTVLASFRNEEPVADRPLPQLEAVNSHAGTMRISYNQRNMIGKLTRIQKTAEETYADVRIPVYQNGRLISTLVSARESGENSEIFSSFEYAVSYRMIERIRYYADGQVQGYDSLVYNAQGQITARHFFTRNEAGSFENHNYQHYTWDSAGNITRLDNYGRTPANGAFALSSVIAYTYDNKPNPQKQVEGLCYITDIMPAFLSANNILTEEIATPNTTVKQVNTFRYEYNTAGYPSSVTAHYGIDGVTETTDLSYK